MPSLKAIRRRISSVKKTQQITRAMRMVSASKLRRAQVAIEAARPYAERMRATLIEVAASQGAEHPLLARHESVRAIDFVVVTSDRGLCGAFNANVLKRAEAEMVQRERDVAGIGLMLVGRKTVEYFRRRRMKQVVVWLVGLGRVDYGQAVEIAETVSKRFLDGETDEVFLVHSEFVNTMTQRPRLVRLLPLAPEGPVPVGEERPPFTIEPNPEALLRLLVPKALQVEIYRALLESQA